MRLALIGYGKMGKAIEALARGRGHEIVAIIDPAAPGQALRDLAPEALALAEVCLEFTHPTAAAGNLLRLCELGKRVVTGTTGWYGRLDEVGEAVARHQAALLYGPNFSIGVNLFYRLVEYAADLFGRMDDRDFYILEAHHRAKADAPSGTARRIEEIVLKKAASKKTAAPAALDRAIRPDELQTVSVRAGWITGTHRVGIEGPHDSIVLEHNLRSREALAAGALQAAEWLAAAAPGLYRFEDVLDEILSRE
jgi:4-hydroxy-tetrahydrodipicolinate reductase